MRRGPIQHEENGREMKPGREERGFGKKKRRGRWLFVITECEEGG